MTKGRFTLHWNCCEDPRKCFPASRGLPRRGKMKREERDLCRLPTSFLSRMPSRFLNNQWRFCHVWRNPENRFEFERERERLLNLSARSNFKWTFSVEDETTLRAAVVVDPITSLWGKLQWWCVGPFDWRRDTTTLTTLLHGVSFHLAHPTTAQVKDVISVLERNF